MDEPYTKVEERVVYDRRCFHVERNEERSRYHAGQCNFEVCVTRGVLRMAAYRRESTGTDKLSEKMDIKG
jgi:hypothetical protein